MNLIFLDVSSCGKLSGLLAVPFSAFLVLSRLPFLMTATAAHVVALAVSDAAALVVLAVAVCLTSSCVTRMRRAVSSAAVKCLMVVWFWSMYLVFDDSVQT